MTSLLASTTKNGSIVSVCIRVIRAIRVPKSFDPIYTLRKSGVKVL